MSSEVTLAETTNGLWWGVILKANTQQLVGKTLLKFEQE